MRNKGEFLIYTVENYKDTTRFNEQYDEIRRFLQVNADSGYNEHFHWGRLDWMMAHSYLDVEMLTSNALFRDENGELAGVVMYDTDFHDRWYVLHSTSDENLLRRMVEYAIKTDAGSSVPIKANLRDTVLCGLLEYAGFEKQYSESVLGIELSSNFSFQLPQGFYLNVEDSQIDRWQQKLVTYRGFDHEGSPEESGEEVAKAERYLETSEYIKVFAIMDGEYVAHCGVWYNGGNTAYIEPVVTVPEHRGKGLGRAVVYEAINRAKDRGAKRAIVFSGQEFYIRLGMVQSSEIGTWVKNSK